MKRSELTVKAMEDMGWVEVEARKEPLIKDIVCYIKDGFYKYLRCTVDKSRGAETRTCDDFEMCATYRVQQHREFLEVSEDNVTWYRVAKRWVETARWCIYAD